MRIRKFIDMDAIESMYVLYRKGFKPHEADSLLKFGKDTSRRYFNAFSALESGKPFDTKRISSSFVAEFAKKHNFVFVPYSQEEEDEEDAIVANESKEHLQEKKTIVDTVGIETQLFAIARCLEANCKLLSEINKGISELHYAWTGENKMKGDENNGNPTA